MVGEKQIHLGITIRASGRHGKPYRASAAPSGLPAQPNPLVDRQGSSHTAKSPSGLTIAWRASGRLAKRQSACLLDATTSLRRNRDQRAGPSDPTQIAEPRRILAGSKSQLLWTELRDGRAELPDFARGRAQDSEAFIAVNSISRRARAQDGNSALARKLEVRSLRDARDQRREPPSSNFRLAA